MTLDDIERPKRHFCRNKTVLWSPPEKKLNEDRSVLSAAKCWPMILVSRNIHVRYNADIRGDFLGKGRQIQ